MLLVSDIQQSESVFFQIIFHYKLLQDIEQCPQSKPLLLIYFMYSSVYLLIPNAYSSHHLSPW